MQPIRKVLSSMCTTQKVYRIEEKKSILREVMFFWSVGVYHEDVPPLVVY